MRSEIEKKIRKHLKITKDSWRVNETNVKIKGKWMYLYRAVDSNGNTIDFILSIQRNARAAKRFFIKSLRSTHNKKPRVITTAKNAVYPKVIKKLKNNVNLTINTEFSQIKYLNDIVEQDHWFIEKIIKQGLEFKSFNTARKTLKEIETFHMIKKGQIKGLNRCALAEVTFINKLFDLAV